MGALAMFSMFIIVQVAYSCIPALQSPSKSNSTEAPSEPPTEEPTKAPTTVQKETTRKPDCVTVDRNPGRTCVFPFTYQYHQHYECLPFKDKFWCALTPVYDKKEWGYCDQTLCPPTAVQATEEQALTPGPGSTTTTAASATTTTTTAEAWEDGTTNIAIKNMDTFACEVDFQYSLQQGVKFREISSVCSGSSSQSNDDVVDKLGNHKFNLKTAEGIELECEIGAVLLEDSKSLSEEVLSNSLKCEVVEADCITVEGEVYPAQCVIPFNYNGRRYLGCTDRPGSTKLWCPTKTDETGGAEDNHWGFCSKKCGYCGGSPITTRDGQEESCGYDCLLGAEWEMVGYDKAPLLKPTIDISLPKEANYIAEKGGQHQLNIGPQSITISCPETKFYDPALKQEALVSVKCGPAKYRLTVSSESGTTLGGNFQNDQFGCDPCPKSTTFLQGFLSLTDFNSSGIFYNIPNVQHCYSLCLESCSCSTFEFSKSNKRCELIQDEVKEASYQSNYKDYVICTKNVNPNEENCGRDDDVDPKLLPAEKHGPYLFKLLDNTKDVTEVYRTKVFPLFSNDGFTNLQSLNDRNELPNTGMFAMFVAPPEKTCDKSAVEQAIISSTEYFLLAVENSSANIEDKLEDFHYQINEIKSYYNGKTPNLCGTATYMASEVAGSRVLVLKQIFNFLLNQKGIYRQFSPNKSCEIADKTVNSIKSSKVFDTTTVMRFASNEMTVFEEDGFLEIKLVRDGTAGKGVAFIETAPGQADLSDFVPYVGPALFLPGSSTSSVLISVKFDSKQEDAETFTVKLHSGSETTSNKRGKEEAALVYLKNRRTSCNSETLCQDPTPHCWRLGEEKDGICVECIYHSHCPYMSIYGGTPMCLLFGKYCTVDIHGKSAGHFAEFDNKETGPFRKREPSKDTDLNGMVILKNNEPEFLYEYEKSRTIYKSTYSSKYNIPIRAIIELDGQDFKETNIKKELIGRCTHITEFVTDLRWQARPKEWNGKYWDWPRLESEKYDVLPGIVPDYTSPFKYGGNVKNYDKGHLVASIVFRTFFVKEIEKMGKKSIVWEFAGYMTNIFPQNAKSNNANKKDAKEGGDFDEFANWGNIEKDELEAGKICLKKDPNNKFYIAKGTIPNNGKTKDSAKALSEWNMINWRWKSPECNTVEDLTDTNVNIPRYIYMAYCCSSAEEGKQTKTHQQYVVFEHGILEEKNTGDKIVGIFDNPTALLEKLKELWQKEHPVTSNLHRPILFKVKDPKPSTKCGGGFDIDPIE